MAPWDPQQYLKFQAERFLPFEDCLQLVERRPGLRVIDLGCGTGELTRRLADALDGSDTVGIDSSAEMLKKAAAQARPGLRFEQRRIEDVEGKWDLVFSHAATQWVDDHAALIPRLVGLVAPGGQLVVQLPSNHEHVSQRVVRALAAEEPFASALAGWSRTSPVLPLPEYAERLWAAGGRSLTVFEKVYPHVLPDADAVVEWTRGTVLVPLLERLPPALHEVLLERYRVRLREAMPGSPVFFGFRRILFSARRA
jgi:trans-aconitate 2-methyltransferase